MCDTTHAALKKARRTKPQGKLDSFFKAPARNVATALSKIAHAPASVPVATPTTHCNTLQNSSTHCTAPPASSDNASACDTYTAHTHVHTHTHTHTNAMVSATSSVADEHTTVSEGMLQHIATHCNSTLQRTATLPPIRVAAAENTTTADSKLLDKHVVPQCNSTLQDTATLPLNKRAVPPPQPEEIAADVVHQAKSRKM